MPKYQELESHIGEISRVAAGIGPLRFFTPPRLWREWRSPHAGVARVSDVSAGGDPERAVVDMANRTAEGPG